MLKVSETYISNVVFERMPLGENSAVTPKRVHRDNQNNEIKISILEMSGKVVRRGYERTAFTPLRCELYSAIFCKLRNLRDSSIEKVLLKSYLQNPFSINK